MLHQECNLPTFCQLPFANLWDGFHPTVIITKPSICVFFYEKFSSELLLKDLLGSKNLVWFCHSHRKSDAEFKGKL